VASFLLAPFWFWEFHPWSSLYSLLFLVLSLLFLLRWIERGRAAELAVAGILASLAFWSRQTVGLVLLVGEAVVLVSVVRARNSPWEVMVRTRNAWGRAVALGLGSGFVLLLLNHSVKGWFADCFSSRVSWALSIPGTSRGVGFVLIVLNCLFDQFRCSFWMLLPLVVLVSLIDLSLGLVRDRQTNLESRLAMLAFLVISAVSWLQYYPVSDPRHHFWSALPFCAAPVILVLHGLSKRSPWALFSESRGPIFRAAVRLVLIVACVGLVLTYGGEVNRRFVTGLQLDPTLRLDPAGTRLAKYSQTFTRPAVLAGMKGTASQVEALSRLSDKITLLTTRVPGVGLVNTSGWDLLARAYADTDRKANALAANGTLKPLIIADDPRAPEGYIEAHHETISSAFAYQASNPGNYYLYQPKDQ